MALSAAPIDRIADTRGYQRSQVGWRLLRYMCWQTRVYVKIALRIAASHSPVLVTW